MKYMLLIYSPETGWTPEEWRQCVVTSSAICGELAEQGKLLAASPLHPVATATTVRVREGKPLVTAGPFAETTEQLGGFYLLEVDNLDEAIAVAGRLPPAKKGAVEIRPLFPLAGLPPETFGTPPAGAPAACKPFIFLCYDDEAFWAQAGPEALRAAMEEAVALTHELSARGQFASAAPLHPSSTATSVRVRNDKRIVTDGPFAETREVLGGYYLIWAADQSEAVSFARRHSGARVGAVEVRELFDLRQLNLQPNPPPALASNAMNR